MDKYTENTKVMKVNKIIFPTFKHLNVNYKEIEDNTLWRGFELLEGHACSSEQVLTPEVLEHVGKGFKVEDGWTVLCDKLIVPEGESVRKCLYFENIDRQAQKLTVHVKKEANARFSFLFNLEKKDLIGGLEFIIEEDAEVELALVFLDGRNVIYNVRSNLVGKGARFIMESGYFAGNGAKYDINSEVNHIAEETECDVNMNGVLDNGASKTYKYCINFPSGCKESKGNETEVVLALGEDFYNTTVPILLVGEDSIEAAHGSTLEEMNPAITDYIQSRGIGDVMTEYMYVLSKLSHSLDMLDDEMKERGCKIVENIVKRRYQ